MRMWLYPCNRYPHHSNQLTSTSRKIGTQPLIKTYSAMYIGQGKKYHAQGQPVDVSSKKPKNCGPKRFPIDLSRVATIAFHKRSTIRKLAKALGVSKSSVHRWFKEGHLRRHSNSLKPFMKDANKKERLRWCLSMLDPTTLPNEPNFIEMDNIIHIDEKWFNATKKNKNFYMLPGEVDPHRTVHNKNSIDKVMVLSAIALPMHDDAGNEIFSGKLGVWPFVRKLSHPFSPNHLLVFMKSKNYYMCICHFIAKSNMFHIFLGSSSKDKS
jgi:hypothetical protein